MRCALYSRCSTEQQTVNMQLDELRPIVSGAGSRLLASMLTLASLARRNPGPR
jgi:DNA invertase Pin-like site-specific DNA recombinase